MTPFRLLLATLALALAVLAMPGAASAQRTHTVREGQSLARIARRYDVRVSDLAAANGLRPDSQVRPGQELRVPEAGVTYVREGQTLSEIAHDAGCSISDLQRLNRLRDGQSLRVGQRIVLPGHVEQAEVDRAASRWGRPRTPGVATIYRTATRTRTRVRLVDTRGRAPRASLRRMQELMRPRGATRRDRYPQPPSRLLELLARVSDHFGGRTIHVVSGFRSAGGYTRETSQHVAGHAIDIRIDGVPNTVLRDYLRTLDRVGVGYYPRSTFVHFDVRDRATYWVDWSRPGEAPRYQRRGEAPPEDATTDERARVGEGGDDVSDEGAEGSVATEEDTEAAAPSAATE
ncbi:LysM peptidoglycan-binding domain-containing protein [Sandaracinus amylolyticus]|uniref:LysM peptidoglycan-binding domain-containing protein n=1 Tax=Sandaracinus amylolyticus TaxID=927083 RepID=UPI001F2D266F|nr:LysM peptidoglycan-binding domain-containing protein [Sandaracinus amylolyticus]UJR79043.1 LysM domain-containing protein [Sandaracinus amylolyticus]